MDRLEAALKTHPGLKRPKNEDAVGGEATPWGGVYVVADGMGGHRTGEVASRLAVETVLARLSREEPPSPKDLLEALEEANGRIHREAQRPENRGMGTTCTVLVLDLPYALVAHVGDSRAYLLREGNLLQLTEDHSWVAERVRQGLLSPRPGWTSSGSSSARGTPSSSAPTGFPGSWRKGPSRRCWPTFPPPRRRSASWPWPTSGAARTT